MSALAGSALLINSCTPASDPTPLNPPKNGATPAAKADDQGENPDEIEVTAAEDLMREHGILRRALFVYSDAAARLLKTPSDIAPAHLQQTATLFRTFGEDYHEQKLEEAFIFPAVKQHAGPAAPYVDVLLVQHQRGREITDYILALTKAVKPSANAAALSNALVSFVRMYEHHMAVEDTIIFPAWKQSVTPEQYDELGEKFEEIEHEQFGKDGFEDAARQIAEIETSLGLADISKFTAAPPPEKF